MSAYASLGLTNVEVYTSIDFNESSPQSVVFKATVPGVDIIGLQMPIRADRNIISIDLEHLSVLRAHSSTGKDLLGGF
jgi:hypothetical protein